jgi:hypothetical protein
MAETKSEQDVVAKLQAIREAMRYDYPAGDIDSMLAEIEGFDRTAEPNPAPPSPRCEGNAGDNPVG